jgi:hypothetical protein
MRTNTQETVLSAYHRLSWAPGRPVRGGSFGTAKVQCDEVSDVLFAV